MGKSVGFGPELVFAWLAAVPRGCWGGGQGMRSEVIGVILQLHPRLSW